MIIFIFYNLRSAFNVGSIFRTGEFLGFKDFILTGYTPGVENKKVLKTSLGAEKNLNLSRKKRILPLLKKFKKDGYQLVSLECPRKRDLFKAKIYDFYNFKPAAKLVVILGNEIEGLPRKILEFSDKIVEIPRQGKLKESLNVSVAFAIFATYLRFYGKIK